MAAKDKETIYVDIDDEITGIIDKLKASDAKVVALVLPKRAGVFQSIVNMKLLKRAANEADKNPVLITSETGLMPLAGAAGLHVAKTLNSKPEIPKGPQGIDDAEETVQEETDAAEPTVGQLAGDTPPPPPADGGMETLTLDDEDLPPEEAAPKPDKTPKPKGKKGGKLKIPNFNRFRLLLILTGVAFVIIIGVLIFITVALPKATIKIKTDATNINTNLNLNLDTNAKSLDASTGTLPAKLASQEKTYSQQVPTTGQKNTGNKASGSVVLTNCSQTNDITLPAGTGLSSSGNTYITQKSIKIPVSSFKYSDCQDDGTASVNIIAQNPGSSYNGATSFTVSGYSSSILSGSPSSSITGGTDHIVQSVNQNDIDSAKNKISLDDKVMKQTLENQLKDDKLYPIAATYVASPPKITNSANVGDQADSVTVTEVITYTMFGVKKDDINGLIKDQVNTQIDTNKQSVLDTGLDKAAFNINSISNTGAQMTMTTKAVAGPALDVNAIKRMAAGKRAGAIKSELSKNPDVTSVDVSISPFWVSNAPKKTSRIDVKIAKPDTTKASNSSDNSP